MAKVKAKVKAKKARRKPRKQPAGLQGQHAEYDEKAPAKPKLLRLNIGSGEVQIPGYINVDRRIGSEAYPLKFASNSAEEIRASHILEHFSFKDTVNVVKEWVRVLAPGGRIKISVPDVDKVLDGYQRGVDAPHEQYLLGAHSDSSDVHLAIFSKDKLATVMAHAGLVEIQPWADDIRDCAALPISLNLQGRKPGGEDANTVVKTVPAVLPMTVQAVMSVPRLGFMDHMFSCYKALVPLGIQIRRTMGAFWSMCIERGAAAALDDNPDAILFLDYDTIFSQADVLALTNLMAAHPEVDALAPVQCHQSGGKTLWTKQDAQFANVSTVPAEQFAGDLFRINTAHFGCTLVRATALRDLPHPWFYCQPAADGTWSEGRVDGDIWFWRMWQKHQKSLYMASRVAVGHAALMVRWPDERMQATIYQPPADYAADGKPAGVWKGVAE